MQEAHLQACMAALLVRVRRAVVALVVAAQEEAVRVVEVLVVVVREEVALAEEVREASGAQVVVREVLPQALQQASTVDTLTSSKCLILFSVCSKASRYLAAAISNHFSGCSP